MSRSPRLLFLLSTLAVGGAERQLALLIERLPERNFEPVVATLRAAGRHADELRELGISVRHVSMDSRLDAAGALRAYRLWRLRPDIVISRSIDAQLVGHAAATRAGAPHVATEHGGLGIRRPLRHRIPLRLVAPRVDRVVAVSETQAPDLRALGYHADAIRFIPNGIPTPAIVRTRADVRRELGVGDDEVLAALVATLRPEKRVGAFVDAITRARVSESRLRGIVVGGGPQLDEIRRMTAGNDGVVVVGERSDALELMAAADAVCLTSAVEGLPMTVLEAMSLGKPVVATDVGGLRDAVSPGATGWLVPPRDSGAFVEALLELARNREHALSMGVLAQERFRERFTVERMVDDYVDLFTEVLSERT